MIILIVILIIFLLLILVFIRPKTYSNSKNITTKREKLAEQFFGNPFSKCNSKETSDSYGILADSVIVCEATKDLSDTPEFYYEEYPTVHNVNGWFFPNMDITNFNRVLQDETAPKVILCKTKQTYNILSKLFKNLYGSSTRRTNSSKIFYTGFTSLDKYRPEIKKEYSRFIHIAGKSPYKGTLRLIDFWLLNPQFPELIIIVRNEIATECKQLLKDREKSLEIGSKETYTDSKSFHDFSKETYADSKSFHDFSKGNQNFTTFRNVTIIDQYLDEKELIEISNRIGIHICSSDHEGFGHYLHEAKAMKAVVLYTDAPPMNETFTNKENGIAIDAEYVEQKDDYCPVYNITYSGLKNAVETVLELNEDELTKIGEEARRTYLEQKQEFRNRLVNLIQTEWKNE